jgi:hypothetical protein
VGTLELSPSPGGVCAGHATDVLPTRPVLKSRLEATAARERSGEHSLIDSLVSEGLDMREHVGIVFRDGPSGRRAALAVGPDVWEVVSALRYTTGTPEQRVAALSEQFDLHPRHIRVAIDYAAAHREQIDAEVRRNDIAATEAESTARSRRALLSS